MRLLIRNNFMAITKETEVEKIEVVGKWNGSSSY